MPRVSKCFGVLVIGLATITGAAVTHRLRAGDVPQVPDSIRDAMHDRNYDEVVAAIKKLLEDADGKPKNADYLVYLKGRAEQLGGKHREALQTFGVIERDFADSPWARRARFAQGASFLKLGDFEAAEQIYETEVRYLLSSERKHDIAAIYLEFADAYFQPPKGIDQKKPDYAKALEFYRKALEVGPNAERRVAVSFRIARAHQHLGQHAEAVAAYEAFLKEYSKTAFEIEARFQLGVAQLALGQNVAARRTWKDLLAQYASEPKGRIQELIEASPEPGANRLAEAAYFIAHTYGLPQAPSKEDLELGVAAAERFIRAYPDHPLAARAALEIAQGYAAHNRLDDAITALKNSLGNPKFSKSDVLPDARVLLGFAYQGQKKFEDAIAAWQEYLAKHPAHASWSQVQQAIIDTEFLAALELRREAAEATELETTAEKFEQARKLWETFIAKYPLDSRAPQIMLEFGLMELELADRAKKQKPDDENEDKSEAQYRDAIVDWTQLVSKYPGTEEASRAQFLIGVVYEEKLGKFDEALAAYRKLNWGQYTSHAQQRVARLTRQELAIVTERVFRTNQKPQIKVTTRNINQLTVRAYHVDLETYFRKMHLTRGIESLDIALIDPAKTWTFEVPDYTEHKELVNYIDIPLESPGVMAVTVANDENLNIVGDSREGIEIRPQEATTMVMVSDIDIIVKSSRNELFVFAQNMRTTKPAPGVKLLVSDGSKVFAEGTTNEEGVFVGATSDDDRTWDPLKLSNDIRVFAVVSIDGDELAEDHGKPHFAANLVGLKGIEFAQEIAPKGYVYTDRPTYRPGQLVNVRGIVRWVKGDEYVFEAGKKFRLDVFDSRNRQIRSEEVSLGDFGSFASRFLLPPETPQGNYRLHVHDPAEAERHNYQGTFVVREYQLPPVHVEIDTPHKVYYRGEEVSGTIKLRYYYGPPVAQREIRYALPDGTTHTAKTNDVGEVAFQFDTREFREDQTLTVAVEFPELNAASGLNLFLATRGFTASVASARDVYLSGESFDVTVTTTDAAGKKIGEKMTLAVVRRTEVKNQRSQTTSVGEQTVEEHTISTDDETGTDHATIKIDQAGTYVLRTIGTDRFGNPISAERIVTVSGSDDSVRLRILSDRHHYKAGETAKVRIHWREQPALALVTYQGARVLGYRIVEIEKGSNELEVPITEKLAPNFDLNVSVMAETDGARGNDRDLAAASERPTFHEASSPFVIERPLVVTLKPDRERMRPGDELKLRVHATDPQGNPVQAEFSLAMIEKSLLDMFPESSQPIVAFFQGVNRESAIRTVSSCVFRYAPATRAIHESILAEAQRVAVEQMEQAARESEVEVADAFSSFGVEMVESDFNAPAQMLGESLDRPRGEDGFGLGLMGGMGGGMMGSKGPAGGVNGRRVETTAAGAIPSFDARDGATKAGRFNSKRMLELKKELGSAEQNYRFFSELDRYAGAGEASRRSGTWRDFTDSDELALYVRALKEGGGQHGVNQLWLLYDNGALVVSDVESVILNKLPYATSGAVVAPFQIRETGYWNPQIVTDEEGNAEVTITVPDRSTAWQLRARGITTGSLSGEASADLVAKKDLFGELKLPLAFVDGDSAQILATVHNDSVTDGKIHVVLKSVIAGKALEEKKTIDASKGTHELTFRREIAGTGDATFELTVRADEDNEAAPEDVLHASVPVHPYGIPVFTTAGGSASSNITAWVSPAAGMPVRNHSLRLLIGPSIERSLIEIVLGSPELLGYRERLLVCESPLERTTSDLMAALGLLKLLEETRAQGSPEAAALADRVRTSIGFLVSSQQEDGGWQWAGTQADKVPSDRNSSARAVWALSLARQQGFSVPDDSHAKATTFVQNAFTAARESDYDGKAMLLHSLTVAGRGDFAYANRLYRSRQSLSPVALVYLALTFSKMDRKEIAREVLDLLEPKLAAQLGAVTASPPVAIEARALLLLALTAIEPGDAKVKETVDWLMAHRRGTRWQPDRATGPATLSIARYFSQVKFDSDHYKLKIFVNDEQVADLEMDASAGSQLVEVPQELLARGEKLPEGQFPGEQRRQRINFELTGRGRFTFHCIYGGFVAASEIKDTTQAWRVTRHYEPAPLELDGREIPRGFDILSGSHSAWRNPVIELPVGQRATVRVHVWRTGADQLPDDQLDYLVVTEPLPSGTAVLEKSIAGDFDRYEIGAGHITFYIGNRRHPGEIRFDIHGYTAGTYRAAPTVVRSFYDPERMAVTDPRPLSVLAAGQKSKDEYRLTPRELYELGKRYVQKGVAKHTEGGDAAVADFARAGEYLTQLFDQFTLKAEVYREVAEMLLDVNLALEKAPAIVRYFEVIKEKYPDLEIPFDKIVKVGAAYREMNEYERSYLVFRATAEGSFIRESQVAGFLQSQGEFLRSIDVMDRILREYPAEPYIASATYALAQQVYGYAPKAPNDPKLRELKVTRIDLIRQAIGRIDQFLTVWPDDPAADQASFSLASALVELENWDLAIARANQFAERYPKSEYLDSFWYIIGYSHFARGQHRAALEMCERVAEATRVDPATGREMESRNKWRAIYIRGQVYHSLGEPAEAIEEYARVSERFPDAKEAIEYFTRKAIELPEVTTVLPKREKAEESDDQDGNKEAAKRMDATVELKFRNVAACELKVYRIDLLKFSLLQRDLSNITKINLAGIHPLHEATITLGDGRDFRDRSKQIELPLEDEGAYLVVCRAEDRYASGLVLVTPLTLDVHEDRDTGRVRATVKNVREEKYASDVHVKVIGSRNDRFREGQTDLRGLFVADGIQGRSTVIARADQGQYAFHRGQADIGPPAPPAAPAASPPQQRAGESPTPQLQQQLLDDLMESNRIIQQQKETELRGIYDKKQQGVEARQAF